MKSRKIFRSSIIAGAFLFIVITVTIGLMVFRQKLGKLLYEKNLQNVTEIQQLYTEMLRSKFEDQFSLMETQCIKYEDVDLTDHEAARKIIMTSKGIGEFKKLAIVFEDGNGFNLNGKNITNIKNRPYFQESMMSGIQKISNRIELDENLEPTLTLISPIKNRERSAIAGTISYNVLKRIFSSTIFSGLNYSYLIAKDGNIILCNKDKVRNLYNVDFCAYLTANGEKSEKKMEKIQRDLINNRAGSVQFSDEGEPSLLTYSPLGINDWFIVSVVPYSYIRNQRRDIDLLVFFLIIFIVVTLSLFILLAYIMLRKSSEIEQANERLTIANNQAQTLIFEYDIQKQVINFSGDTQFILGTEKDRLSIEFVKAECFKRVHPEDANILEHLIAAIRNGDEEYIAEFRYRNFMNEFFWVRMTGTNVMESEGKVKKFIGSISNVNAQILHEQELKNLAERDKLSNLLNKSAMEHKCRSYINREANGKLCALFIIDLDNFKSVNDSLGHMTGDMAIKDAAKKISLIFSEKDYLSRFGGDEFCILMRFSERFTKDEVITILKAKAVSLCETLEEDYFNNDITVPVSASIGIALYPDGGSSYEDLFVVADEALYEVKQHGKNGYRIAGVE